MSTPKSLLEEADERLYNTKEKWYVRNIWLNYCRNRMERNNQEHIKLLTLTCTKIYEIQFFLQNDLLIKNDVGFDSKCLAFCEMNQHRFALIRNKLPGAKNFLGSFENLVGTGRVDCASNKEKWFPFNVVNLDMKGCILGERARALESISKLFIIQKLKRTSFTLFLTICSDQNGDSTDKILELQNLLNNNLKNNDQFERIFQKYPTGIIPYYYEFQSITIPKKIIEMGFSESFNVYCAEKITYIGGNNTNRMLSFVFNCEFVGGMALQDLVRIKNCRLLELYDKNFVDINQLFDGDPEVRTTFEEFEQRFAD